MSASAGDRDWASLPMDLLGSIAERLSVMDYIRFRAVCTSWSSVASPKNGLYLPLAPQMPYLLLPGEDGDRSESCTLLSLPDNRSYRIAPLPEIRGMWCVGSQHGWLVTLDEFSNPNLLNPLTRSQIHLPAITTLPYVDPIHDSDGSLAKYLFHINRIYDTIPGPIYYPLKEFRDLSFRKVVLSSSPSSSRYAAVAIFHFSKLLLFARAGEEKWTLLEEKECFEDVIYRDGKFLAVTYTGDVTALDLNSTSPQMTFVARGFEGPGHHGARYLVDSSGDLLQVCRDSDYVSVGEGKNMFRLKDIVIMRLDPEQAAWVPMKSLGDHTLFLGTCYSKSLSAQDIPGLKRNCIYFTDDAWELFDEEVREMIRDVGVLNLGDGSLEHCHPPDPRLNWPPPIWITPTLC